MINSHIKLRPGAEGSVFIGLYTNYDFQASVNNITIQRCWFNFLKPESSMSEWFIEESRFNAISRVSTFICSDFVILKCIINETGTSPYYTFGNLNDSRIINCTFLVLLGTGCIIAITMRF